MTAYPYINTDHLLNATSAEVEDVKPLFDALNDAIHDVQTIAEAIQAAPIITASATSALSGETTLTAAMATPPTIGGTTPAGATFTAVDVKPPNGTTDAAVINVGQGRGGDGSAIVDLISDAATYTDFGTRISRAGGANGATVVTHRGTGEFQLNAQEAATIRFLTSNTSRMTIASGGAVAIAGPLTKGSGTFKIHHPLDPENAWLYHSFIEGPKCDLIYRGRALLTDGAAVVDLDLECRMRPGTFEALTQNPQVWLQNEDGWDRVRGRVQDGVLTIECENPASTDAISWMVVAERADELVREWDLTDDDGVLIPEHDKTDEEKAEYQLMFPPEPQEPDTEEGGGDAPVG